ncbi:hypothetical protein EV421DRAFT_1153715 [Armillaria borealis]|uniref:Uncharacterized protein n=1 Tax=Armillaria borealis TaxID=47425 RepID=A0AA39MJ73_9AGAR|nr:hypothetical protein EV421DRAFT_1153715 [Armillaria borealis]
MLAAIASRDFDYTDFGEEVMRSGSESAAIRPPTPGLPAPNPTRAGPVFSFTGSRFHPRRLVSLIAVTLSLALSADRLDMSILTYTHPPVVIFLFQSWFACLRFYYPAVGTFFLIVNLLSCIFGLFPPIWSTLSYLFYHCGGFITLIPRYIIQSFYVSYRALCDLISSACFAFLLAFQFGPGYHY